MITPRTTTPAEVLQAGDVDALIVALAEHPFTRGFDAERVRALAELSSQVRIDRGRFVFLQNQAAGALYLLSEGTVALEMVSPGRPPQVLETIHAGDVLGWSWLFPPYRWHLDAHALTAVTAFALDAARLRELMAADPRLGHDVALRVGSVLVDRLHHARAQLVSVQLP